MGLFSIFDTNTAYFLDCSYYKFKLGFELYQRIFSKLGIRFKILDKNICCGVEPWEVGYDLMARRLANENFDNFNKNEIKSIITTNPGSYKMFLQNYPEYVPFWNIEVINIWALILERLKNKPSLIKNKKIDKITYHDSCYLGRYCKIYDEPRKILNLLGFELNEMDNHKENSFCCGSCGGLPRISPVLADRIAKERILQAKRINVNKMIVIGYENYSLLKNKSRNMDFNVFEFSDILGDALGIIKINL